MCTPARCSPSEGHGCEGCRAGSGGRTAKLLDDVGVNHRRLDVRLPEVFRIGAWIRGQRLARKHPQPCELTAGIRVPAVQGIGHPHAGKSRPAVGVVLRFHLAQMRAQVVPAHLGEQRRSILVSLASPDKDQPLIEVDILDPQLAALGHAQAAAVDERRHQARRPRHCREQHHRFWHAQEDRQALTAFRSDARRQVFDVDAQHLAAQEQNRATRLILRAGRDVSVDRQVREVVARDLGRDASLWRSLPASYTKRNRRCGARSARTTLASASRSPGITP